MIEAFIFDVDGTLADTYPLILRAFNKFAVKYTGREWSLEEIVAQFGPPESDIIANQVETHLRNEAIEYYYWAYEELHDGTSVYEGVPELLDELEAQSKKLAIFTGKGRRSAAITLEKLGLAGRFDPVITGDDVQKGKPYPEGVLKAIEAMNVPPSKVAMVGDHASDVLAGRAAGVLTIGALWHAYNSTALLGAEPDMVFKTPADMLKWIKGGDNA